MKKAFILLFILSNLSLSKKNIRDCSSSGIFLLSESKSIGLNQMIIIEGYAHSQKTINSFNDRNLYLVTDKDKVLLNHKATYVGQMELTQAIFTPSILLKPNTTYYIELENQTAKEKLLLRKWNNQVSKYERLSITTGNKRSVNLNLKNIKFKFSETSFVSYGCGPETYSSFKIINQPKEKIFYKTEVKNITTGKIKSYYLKSNKNEISIGHGMCSGAFVFTKNDNYTVRFTPINPNGELSIISKWVPLKNPYANHKNGW
tara:strand:- start:13280 stop:14059 length:780 start_codon:yes stop_codon:yes gene_type:complete